MKNKIIAAIVTSAAVAPAFVFAQSLIETRITSILGTVRVVIFNLIPVAFALAVLYFFYGMAKYILDSGNEEQKLAGKNIMINGIIALFVMVSIYGIINLLSNFTGADNNTAVSPTITLPTVK